MFNKLLLRQLGKHIGSIDMLPEEYIPLFRSISESFDHYEKDRLLIERSMELSSKEMIDLNSKLRNESEKIQRVNEELNRTNHELDKFVYSVSHDLRAPLSSMNGVIEIAEDDTADPLLLGHFSLLKGSVKKLDDFIQDLLEYSRNSRLEVKKQDINFNDMLDEIAGNLKYMNSNNKKQVDLKFEVLNRCPFISDKARISILLNNLISNAIRYQNPATSHPQVEVKINMSDSETGIIVKDNGIGISKENQEKVFEMFYRVSEDSVGSGLGLYLVKEIVEKLHGEIKIESEVGKGTTFNVSIPNSESLC